MFVARRPSYFVSLPFNSWCLQLPSRFVQISKFVVTG